ncbi:MAG: hypothetical protein ABI859_04500 [Pseudomonadota bacterium]
MHNYEQLVTAILVPEESSAGYNTREPQRSPEPPYWKFTLPDGNFAGLLPNNRNLTIVALYPSMSHFHTAIRDRWVTRNALGGWGPDSLDVLRIGVTFSRSKSNDAGAQAIGSIEKLMAKRSVPAELAQRVPSLRAYSASSDLNKPFDAERVELAFTQEKGRQVFVSACWKSCWAVTTWRGALRLRYSFPKARLAEIAEIDSAIQTLLDSAQPTLVQ